jgi:hypothetical protein
LFKDRGNDGLDAGGGGLLSAQLSHAQMVEPAPARMPSLAERYAGWRHRISERFAEVDLVPDLAQDIGSRRWLRGAGTLLGLSALALAGLARLRAARSRAGHAHRRPGARRVPQPDDHAARARRRQRPAHGRDRAGGPAQDAPERPRLDLEATLAAATASTACCCAPASARPRPGLLPS